MNVELPDGTVVEDVPEGISRRDLATKLKSNGMNVPDEWLAPKKVGFVESAMRTAGTAAQKAVGMFDMAAAGLARTFGSDAEVEKTLDIYKARQEGMGQAYGTGPDEELSGPGAVAGGVLSAPIEMAGGFGLQHGIERAGQVVERGGSLGEAATAGGVSGGVHAALNLLPVKAGGVVGRAVESRVGAALGGALTGGAVAAGAGAAGRVAENAALPEGDQYKDMEQPAGNMRAVLTDAGMGAAFGAIPGVHASVSKAKAKATEKASAFPADKMTDAGNGEYRAPNGSTITKEMWDASSQRVRDGWLVPEEKIPTGEATEKTGTLPDAARLAEIDRLKESATSDTAKAALDEEAKKLNKRVEAKAKRDQSLADAQELRRVANETTDPELQASLRAKADKLEAAEKVPVGQVKESEPEVKDETPKKPLPVAEVAEGQPDIDAQQPTRPLPVGEAREFPSGVEAAPEVIPAGEAKPLFEDSGRPPAGESQPRGELPRGEATELTGEAAAAARGEPVAKPDVAELTGEAAAAARGEKIPAGEAREVLPEPDVIETPAKIPAGEAREVTDSGVEPAPEKIPAGEAKELYADKGRGETLASLDFPKLDAAFMHEQTRAQQAREPAEPAVLERGRRQARAALEKGAADGSLGKDESSLALWALDKNPNLARGLRIEAPKGEKGDNARGVYESANRVVKLFQGKGSPDRAAHEILHHSERMMPEVVQRGIRREWRRAVEAEMKKAKPAERAALKSILDGITGSRAAFEEMKDAFKSGALDIAKHYHLTNPSEFWAVNAARLLTERHAGRNAWRTDAVRWLKEMVEHVKGAAGLRSDAPVLKALDHVLNAEKNRGTEQSTGTLKTAEAKATIAAEEKLFSVEQGKRKLDDETKSELVVRKLFDRSNRVAKLQKTVEPKSEDADILGADALYSGRAQQRGDELNEQVMKPLGKALQDAKKAGISVRDADDYLMALHAPERNKVIAARNPKMQDGGSGLTNAQAKAIVEGFTPAQRKHLDAVAAIVHGLHKRKLDAMVEDGLITAKKRDELNGQYKNYVPLKTLDEEAEFTGVGRGYEMRANDITAALGRSTKASSPIAASVMDASREIMRGEKARVDRTIWEYAKDPKAQDFIQPYDEKNPPAEVLGRKIGPDGKVKSIVDAQKVQDLTLSLVIDGEQQRVFVPDELLRDQLRKVATANDPGPVLAAIGRGTGTVGRMLTEFNPAFTVPNAVKDAITVAVRAGAHDKVSAAKTVAGIPSAWKAITQYKRGKDTPDAKLYKEFLETGGKTGAYGIQQLSDTMRKLEKAGAELGYEDQKGGYGRRLKNALGSAAHLISSGNEVMEYASRFALYKEMRAVGETPRAAARAAKEITVNFNRSGEYGRTLNSVLVFANAALQGLRNTAVYAKSPVVRRGMLAMVALGAAAQAYNEQVGGQNEETGEPNINSQNDPVADKNLVVLAPGSKSGAKIPLPPEYAVLFAIGRRLWRAASQKDVGREAAGIAGAVLDATLPVRLPDADSSALAVGKALVPTLASPFADLWTKQNYFGQPIVPEQVGDHSPAPHYTKSRANTSDIAKGISQLANAATGGDAVTPGLSQKALGPLVAPEGIEHIVGFYTGGLGQLAMQSKNIADSVIKDKPVDVNKLPIANRFVFEEPKSYTSRRYKELAPQFEYARDYQKAGTPEKIDPKVARALPEFEAAERELRGLFKELRAAGAAGQDAEPIQARIKAVQARVIKSYNGQPT
jgi:hypothetical protein